MKRRYFFLLFLFTLILPRWGHSQDKVQTIDSLLIDFWPDYDRPSILVLLTGTLSPDTKLPVSVTLPFPETAQLNAIARIDGSDGTMKDDVLSSPAPGEITFILPDLRFRVEYYLPYAVNDNQRAFNFTWLADLTVNRLQLKVQQPISAISLSTDPATENVSRGRDGFTYHSLPAQTVQATQSFSIKVDYTMRTAKLSADSLAPAKPSPQDAAAPPTSNFALAKDWPILAVIVGGLIIVIIFTWQIAIRRAASEGPATNRTTAGKKPPSRFCTKCGNRAGKEDKFCGGCGASL